jgi:S-adenosylmethionine synthetase
VRIVAKGRKTAQVGAVCCEAMDRVVSTIGDQQEVRLRDRRRHHVDEARIEKTLNELMNLSPRGIREHLHLNRPIYVPTSAYGHFGREPDEEKGTFTWERTDLVPGLRTAFGR